MGDNLLNTLKDVAPYIETAGNYMASSNLNKKNRKFAREMYERQRQDALDDWYRTTAYNSPGEQMNRLKQAGLNPQLVYGNGADAQVQSMPRASSYASPTQVEQRLQLGQATAEMYAIQAQREQNKLTQQQIELAKIAQLQELTKLDTSKWDLEVKKEFDKKLQEASLTALQVNTDKTRTDIELSIQRNAREIIAQSLDTKETMNKLLDSQIGRINSLSNR